MWHWPTGMEWWMMFGGIWLILLLGGIIALVVWVVKKVTERGSSGSSVTGGRSPLDIAKERYARGEISREQFEQIKKDLS